MLTTGVHAQNSIHRVLKEIEENNKTLQAKEKLTDAQKLETQTGKYLENPTAEFEKMWGNRNNPESEYSFIFKQSPRFPFGIRTKKQISRIEIDFSRLPIGSLPATTTFNSKTNLYRNHLSQETKGSARQTIEECRTTCNHLSTKS